MDRGWVKSYRKEVDWEWFTEPYTAHLFHYLVLAANRAPGKWKGIDVPVGGVITSRSQLAKKTGLSEKQVRTALKHLISTNEVASHSTTKYTLLIVNNYSLYQCGGQVKGQQRASQGPSEGQQGATNKKSRKKEVKKDDDRSGFAVDDQVKSFSSGRSGKIDSQEFDFASAADEELTPEVASSFKAYCRHWRKKPTEEEAKDWITVLKSLPSEDAQLKAIKYSSGGSGKWYRGIYPDRFLEKTNPTNSGLPDWYSETASNQARAEDVETALKILDEVLDEKEIREK